MNNYLYGRNLNWDTNSHKVNDPSLGTEDPSLDTEDPSLGLLASNET